MPQSIDKLKLAMQNIVGKRMPDVNSWQTTIAIILNADENTENTVSSIANRALLTNKEVSDSLRVLINSGFKMSRSANGNLLFNIGKDLIYTIIIPTKKQQPKETGSTEIFISNKSVAPIEDQAPVNSIMDDLILAIDKRELADIDAIVSENKIDWDYADSTNTTVLSKACEKNNINILTKLINEGLRPQEGLMWACQNGNKYRGLIAFFIKHGANANIGEGLMPLQWAIFTGAIGVAQELMERGADVNYVSDSGEPLLQMAIDSDNKQVVELLLLRDVVLDISNSDGDGPLHWAVTTGAIDIIKMLIFADCSLDTVNYAGKTIFDLASELGKESVIRILEKHS
jgi:ankyrin repeat protein